MVEYKVVLKGRLQHELRVARQGAEASAGMRRCGASAPAR